MQSTPATTHTCPICQDGSATVFMDLPDVPVYCNVLYDTRAQAQASSRGDICLAYCRACGHIFNVAFDPAKVDYSPDYENSLHFSERFQHYAEALASRLIEQHSLRNKDLVEIGCGGGDFLNLLCDKGRNRGVGFDPGYREASGETVVSDRVRFIRGEFTENDAALPADFVCSRHVLEHLLDPLALLTLLRRTLASGGGTRLYFEVPNVLYTLRDQGIWDLIYEHVGYFTSHSLASLCERAGFDLLRLSESYEGQFLSLDAESRPGTGRTGEIDHESIDAVSARVEQFTDTYAEKKSDWEAYLRDAGLRGERVIAWGAGSKGVTFLNVLQAEGRIERIVDINPRKHGKFVAGTGQEVVPPEYLKDYTPDRVVLMNPVYLEEVRSALAGLGVRATVAVA